jgi:hypothetical protein
MHLRVISALALLTAAAGCGGTLSNDDLAFIEAVPQKDALHVNVPARSAQALGVLGQADVFIAAQDIAAGVNSGLDGVLGLLDLVRGTAPSTRSELQRTWGPWPDQQHPGVEYQVVMDRELDASGNLYRFKYALNGRRAPAGYLPVIDGYFYGAQARDGSGTLNIEFDNSHALGINKANDPLKPMDIQYDFAGDPRTLDLNLGRNANGGFGLSSFDYGYAIYADGHGLFDYAFPDGKGNLFTVQTTFAASAAGKALIDLVHPPFFEDKVTECWDDTLSLTFISDPASVVSQCSGVVAPCVLGSAAACP